MLRWFLVYREQDLANNCWRVSKVIDVADIIDINCAKEDLRHQRCRLLQAIDELAAYKQALEEK